MKKIRTIKLMRTVKEDEDHLKTDHSAEFHRGYDEVHAKSRGGIKAVSKAAGQSPIKSFNSESGVSNVIGVMMMLTIVIILAAMVSGFADGSMNVKTDLPSANLAVSAPYTDSGVVFIVENRGGDVLSGADCSIVTFIDDKQSTFMLSDLDCEKLTAGRKAFADTTKTAKLLGLTQSALNGYAQTGKPMEVAIYHNPSNTLLYKSKIILGAEP